ncbi:MAG: hypothetical protein JWO67_4890, partial [Streptosporangiaceae bacterium]|nr:hypothetical protein [Streptosporangiaceae bacterium]
WIGYFRAPWVALSDIEVRLVRIQAGVEQLPLLLGAMETRMTAQPDAPTAEPGVEPPL